MANKGLLETHNRNVCIFSSSDKFVTGNSSGSVSLFNGVRLLKTMLTRQNAGYRFYTPVAYFNGQVVAERNGTSAIMNEELEIIKILNKPQTGSLETISANGAFLAICDDQGGVFCYTRNSDMEPMVSSISVLSSLNFILVLYS